jgi:hypothetical protein
LVLSVIAKKPGIRRAFLWAIDLDLTAKAWLALYHRVVTVFVPTAIVPDIALPPTSIIVVDALPCRLSIKPLNIMGLVANW